VFEQDVNEEAGSDECEEDALVRCCMFDSAALKSSSSIEESEEETVADAVADEASLGSPLRGLAEDLDKDKEAASAREDGPPVEEVRVCLTESSLSIA